MAQAGAIGGRGLSTTRLRRRVARRPRTVLLPGVETLEGRVVPSTITVTNPNNDGVGSLRAAIELAELDAAEDTIDFASSATGTITLLSALPDLSTPIMLIGPGSSALTVARSSDPSTPEFRIFNVTVDAEVAISGLTISGGRVSVGFGGGIANSGTLTITSSTISGNAATTVGGGIFNLFGTLTVANSTVNGNFGGGFGGGIYDLGTLTVTNSTISGNSASGSGGGIASFGFGTVTITDSTLNGNSASDGGGGILNMSTVTITNSTISGNSAINGGGISNDVFRTVTITNSTISGNSASGSGGGIASFGTVTVTNSTISGNSTVRFGRGGGISIKFGTVTVTNSTFSGNLGGGIANSSGTLTVATSLFANAAGGNLSQESAASFVSGGHNLFSDAPAVALDPTDLINTDPLLGPLADYGGPTPTMALLPGSPAIDAGRAVPGVTTDQRGVPRPQGAAPDIGAFESRGFSLVIVAGDHQGAPGGSSFPTPLAVRVASPFGEPVAGGRVRFSAPTAGASASFTANPAPIDTSGQASVLATANGLGGPFVVTAQAAGAATSLAFILENLVMPLTVVGVQRFGVHAQPTTLVLRFSASIDPARAQDAANYRIVTLGGHGRGGSRVGQVTRVRAAVYDPATDGVTLHLARRLDLRNVYRLTVRGTGPGGLSSPTGVLLDGAGTGQPGSDFVATIDRGTLAGSSRGFFRRIRHRWAGHGGVTERVLARAIDVLVATGRSRPERHWLDHLPG